MTAAASGLRLAVGTLTVVPVGAVRPTRSSAAWAMSLAPVAVLPLALAAAAVAAIGEAAALPVWVVAALLIAVLAVGSRGMHVDGLADTIDGLGAGWSRERALEVMRKGDLGPMGGAAVVLVLLVQTASAATVLGRPWGWVQVALAVVVSRAACTLTCARGVPAARPEGLGAVVAGSVPRPVALVVLVSAAGLLGLCARLAGSPAALGVAAVVALVLVTMTMVRLAVRVFGGVTGDVMGAAIELSLGAVLVVLSSGVGR